VTVTISHAQRDAIYGQILDRLSGIEDIYTAAANERYEQADRLGREFSDELWLILDDLGWGDGPELETIELTTPPDVLRRVFDGLQQRVAGERDSRRSAWDQHREEDQCNRLVGEACVAVLAMLGGDEIPR
jgi:hypothetical protein